jgi:hypothetical protein
MEATGETIVAYLAESDVPCRKIKDPPCVGKLGPDEKSISSTLPEGQATTPIAIFAEVEFGKFVVGESIGVKIIVILASDFASKYVSQSKIPASPPLEDLLNMSSIP